MGLPPPPGFFVNFGMSNAPSKPFTEPNFENYRTVSLERDFMRKTIGTGTPLFRDGDFLGFDPTGSAGGRPRRPGIHDACKLQLGVWLGFVPECYRAEVERGALLIGEQKYKNTPIRPNSVHAFIEDLRFWIGSNVEPK